MILNVVTIREKKKLLTEKKHKIKNKQRLINMK